MTGPDVDLAQLLQSSQPCPVDLWLDPVSPATAVIMPHLDLDGLSNGGQPWRLRGRVHVGLRLLPNTEDDLSALTARCLLAARAWAVQREDGDLIVPMDYDLPWGYLASIQRDLAATREFGLPHLVAVAGRHGDWLGDWVAEYHEAPEVRAALAAEVEAAAAAEVTEAPAVVVSGHRFAGSAIPNDLADQVSALLTD